MLFNQNIKVGITGKYLTLEGVYLSLNSLDSILDENIYENVTNKYFMLLYKDKYHKI